MRPIARRTLGLAALAFAPLAFGSRAYGAGPAFTQAAFESAQDAGKPILLHVHADWCPVCKAQQPTLSGIASDAKFKDLVQFTIDYDNQKDVVRRFNVRGQSTLIAFRGKAEMGRSQGATDPYAIRALAEKTL